MYASHRASLWRLVFFSSADGRAFCHSHDGPIAAAGDGDGAYIVLCVKLRWFICNTYYTNFPVLLLFQIKIRITPVVRVLHTQTKTSKKHTHTHRIKSSTLLEIKQSHWWHIGWCFSIYLHTILLRFSTQTQHTRETKKTRQQKHNIFSMTRNQKKKETKKKSSFWCKCTKRCRKMYHANEHRT